MRVEFIDRINISDGPTANVQYVDVLAEPDRRPAPVASLDDGKLLVDLDEVDAFLITAFQALNDPHAIGVLNGPLDDLAMRRRPASDFATRPPPYDHNHIRAVLSVFRRQLGRPREIEDLMEIGALMRTRSAFFGDRALGLRAYELGVPDPRELASWYQEGAERDRALATLEEVRESLRREPLVETFIDTRIRLARIAALAALAVHVRRELLEPNRIFEHIDMRIEGAHEPIEASTNRCIIASLIAVANNADRAGVALIVVSSVRYANHFEYGWGRQTVDAVVSQLRQTLYEIEGRTLPPYEMDGFSAAFTELTNLSGDRLAEVAANTWTRLYGGTVPSVTRASD